MSSDGSASANSATPDWAAISASISPSRSLSFRSSSAIRCSSLRDFQKNASSRVSAAISTTTRPSLARPVRPFRWMERMPFGTGS